MDWKLISSDDSVWVKISVYKMYKIVLLMMCLLLSHFCFFFLILVDKTFIGLMTENSPLTNFMPNSIAEWEKYLASPVRLSLSQCGVSLAGEAGQGLQTLIFQCFSYYPELWLQELSLLPWLSMVHRFAPRTSTAISLWGQTIVPHSLFPLLVWLRFWSLSGSLFTVFRFHLPFSLLNNQWIYLFPHVSTGIY